MATCKACGRTGVQKLKRAIVVGNGPTVTGLVCLECAARAVRIVARLVAPQVVERVERSLDVERIIGKLRMFAHAAVATSKDGVAEDFLKGRAEGLEAAIEVLRRDLC